jgi:hypothetical protein
MFLSDIIQQALHLTLTLFVRIVTYIAVKVVVVVVMAENNDDGIQY